MEDPPSPIADEERERLRGPHAVVEPKPLRIGPVERRWPRREPGHAGRLGPPGSRVCLHGQQRLVRSERVPADRDRWYPGQHLQTAACHTMHGLTRRCEPEDGLRWRIERQALDRLERPGLRINDLGSESAGPHDSSCPSVRYLARHGRLRIPDARRRGVLPESRRGDTDRRHERNRNGDRGDDGAGSATHTSTHHDRRVGRAEIHAEHRVLQDVSEALVAVVGLHASGSFTPRVSRSASRPRARCTRTVLALVPSIEATSSVSNPAQSRRVTAWR